MVRSTCINKKAFASQRL